MEVVITGMAVIEDQLKLSLSPSRYQDTSDSGLAELPYPGGKPTLSSSNRAKSVPVYTSPCLVPAPVKEEVALMLAKSTLTPLKSSPSLLRSMSRQTIQTPHHSIHSSSSNSNARDSSKWVDLNPLSYVPGTTVVR